MKSPVKYSAPWWMPDGHSQTILPAKAANKPIVRFHRTRWDTPDGDFIDLDFTAPVESRSNYTEMWVLFHGLEGSSDSHYARSVMKRASEAGALGVVPHFRGCSGENNRMPRAYHSGDSAEIHWVLHRLRKDYPLISTLHVVGVSLGGNALLKWLGEQGADASKVATTAVSVSAPVDLLAGANSLAKGFNLVYTRMFLSTLIPKSLEKISRYPDLGTVEEIASCKDFFDFDNRVTARWHGFKDAEDYYAKSSAKQFLPGIKVPTLMIHALNDPFMTGQYLPKAEEVSSDVHRLFPPHGGHVGFANAKGFRLGLNWLPDTCQGFFQNPEGVKHG